METEAPVGSIEAKDPFAVAPPGHSLTEDNSKWAWGKPPQIVDPEQALEVAIASLQKPKVRDEMFKLLYTGVSVEVMVEGYVLQAFHDGKFMPDVGMLIRPPLGMYIAYMAEEAGIAQARSVLDVTLGILYSKGNTSRKLGYHVASDWEDMISLMKEFNDLQTSNPSSAFYTNQFIP